MMRQRGDGLSHRGQSFTLHQRRVIKGVFDCQGGLMSDRSDQPKMVIIESFVITFGTNSPGAV